jgi:hypothetical protein
MLVKKLVLAVITGILVCGIAACGSGYYKGELETAQLVGQWQAKIDDKLLNLDLRKDGSFSGEGIPILTRDLTVSYLNATGHWSIEENQNKNLRSRWKLLLSFTDQKIVEKWDLVSGKGSKIELRYVTDIDLDRGIRFAKVDPRLVDAP